MLLPLAAAAATFKGAEIATSDLRARDLTALAVPPRFLEGEPTVLVSGGVAGLPVVYAGAPREREAAEYFADTVAEMTGVRPEVREGPYAHAAVFVGDASTADAEADERFTVEVADGSIRFGGRADYAVYDFCERALGVRFYWPAAAGGKWVPKTEGLAVRSFAYEDRPVFALRTGSRTDWYRAAKAGNAHYGRLNVHAPHRWRQDGSVPREIFAQGAGTDSPMLCYGNPVTLRYYERRIDEHIAGVRDSGGIVDSERKIVTVSPWDAEYDCRCMWCRTLRSNTLGPTGEASPIVWGRFLKGLSRWLKAHHPDYRIEFLPYWNYVLPPRPAQGGELELEDNCEAYVCTVPGMAYLKYEPRRLSEVETLRRWAAITNRKVINWDYACWPCESTPMPYVYGETIRRQCADLRDVSDGTFVCGTKETARQSLSLYVWMRCLWNPELDVEAVYDGFCERMFGPAAATMRRLVALQERAWDPPELRFTPEDCAEIHRLLMQAEAEVAGDRECERRFEYYLSGFERFFRYLESGSTADFAAPSAAPNPMR